MEGGRCLCWNDLSPPWHPRALQRFALWAGCEGTGLSEAELPWLPQLACSWALQHFLVCSHGWRLSGRAWSSGGSTSAVHCTNTRVRAELFCFETSSFTPGSRIAQPRGQPGGLRGAQHSFHPCHPHGTEPSLVFHHPLCRPGLLKTH